MNILGWIFDEYQVEDKSEKQWGYLFTVDGRRLEFEDFIPMNGYDILEMDFLSDTETCWLAPCLACCFCGFINCNPVQTLVKIDGDLVFWTVFTLYNGKPKTFGGYCFDRADYCKTINSLLEHIKNAKANDGQ